MPTINIYIPDEDYDRVVTALGLMIAPPIAGEPYTLSEELAKGALLEYINKSVKAMEHDDLVRDFVHVPPGVKAPRIWRQPLGSEGNLYAPNEVVMHQGKIWRNTHGSGNVWVPGEYGWEEA